MCVNQSSFINIRETYVYMPFLFVNVIKKKLLFFLSKLFIENIIIQTDKNVSKTDFL